jgi:putative oxidoreductase
MNAQTARLDRTTNTAAAGMNDFGKLLLRVSLGVLILLHGIAKVSGGVGFISGSLAKVGMPSALAYGVYIGEIVAPLFLILGLWTRAAALVVVVNMLFAVGLVHSAELFAIGKTGGYALELQAMYLFAALAVAFLGAGRYSLGGVQGRWN